MKSLIAVLAVLFLSLPAAADTALTVGPGGVRNMIEKDGDTTTLSEMSAEVEYQVALDEGAKHWLGLVTSFDGKSETKSLGARWYMQLGDGVAYPGLGVGTYFLNSSDSEAITSDTMFLGAELLLEIEVPMGESYLPVTAMAGVYPSITGDPDATLIRIGVKVAPDLFQ